MMDATRYRHVVGVTPAAKMAEMIQDMEVAGWEVAGTVSVPGKVAITFKIPAPMYTHLQTLTMVSDALEAKGSSITDLLKEPESEEEPDGRQDP